MEPYHNKGFGLAFLTIIFVTLILPIAAMMTIDDTWDRLLQKYGDPWKSDCWENSRHEVVCYNPDPEEGQKLAECKFWRNFCK